ncbi:hypothetical protein IC582_021280 [Cucumis melo]
MVAYRSLIGSLKYLNLMHLDLSHAVNCVYQQLQSPIEKYLRVVKRILRYIKGTINYDLPIFKQTTNNLYVFGDADWVGCTTTRHSTIRFCVYHGANCISWSSEK